jgi:ATP-dependent DNA helicase RecG
MRCEEVFHARDDKLVSVKDSTEEQTYLPASLRPAFAKLGIQHLRDMALHLPMRYEDQTRVVPINELTAGQSVVVEGIVDHSETVFRPRRQFVALIRTAADDGGHNLSPRLTLRYFNFYPSIVAALKPGNAVRVYGEIRDGYYGLEMVHPIFKKADAVNSNAPEALSNRGLTPVYPSGAGVPQAALRTLATKSLKIRDVIADYVPATILDTQKLRGTWRLLCFTRLQHLNRRLHLKHGRIRHGAELNSMSCSHSNWRCAMPSVCVPLNLRPRLRRLGCSRHCCCGGCHSN